MLKTVLRLFGEAIKESLTRTMADYLEATGGRLRNADKTEFEKDIASRMKTDMHEQPGRGTFCYSARFFTHIPNLKAPHPSNFKCSNSEWDLNHCGKRVQRLCKQALDYEQTQS
jgi:hypothetical protein